MIVLIDEIIASRGLLSFRELLRLVIFLLRLHIRHLILLKLDMLPTFLNRPDYHLAISDFLPCR